MMYTTEKFDPATFAPARFESDGEIQLRGQRVPTIRSVRTMCSTTRPESPSRPFSPTRISAPT